MALALHVSLSLFAAPCFILSLSDSSPLSQYLLLCVWHLDGRCKVAVMNGDVMSDAWLLSELLCGVIKLKA